MQACRHAGTNMQWAPASQRQARLQIRGLAGFATMPLRAVARSARSAHAGKRARPSQPRGPAWGGLWLRIRLGLRSVPQTPGGTRSCGRALLCSGQGVLQFGLQAAGLALQPHVQRARIPCAVEGPVHELHCPGHGGPTGARLRHGACNVRQQLGVFVALVLVARRPLRSAEAAGCIRAAPLRDEAPHLLFHGADLAGQPHLQWHGCVRGRRPHQARLTHGLQSGGHGRVLGLAREQCRERLRAAAPGHGHRRARSACCGRVRGDGLRSRTCGGRLLHRAARHAQYISARHAACGECAGVVLEDPAAVNEVRVLGLQAAESRGPAPNGHQGLVRAHVQSGVHTRPAHQNLHRRFRTTTLPRCRRRR
mmetsp:Transcript_23061/g.71915  ORF Transcript_23061/g.71915 Transcript_23061/m.71915 type:complete len:366 (-) Transcript_23061:353-1450(-)